MPSSETSQRIKAAQFGLDAIQLGGIKHGWKSTTIEQFIKDVDGYIRWHDQKRIKISLGARSPIEYRNSLGIVT